MPELPEVETQLRALEQALSGHKIQQCTVRNHRLRWPVAPDFATRLTQSRLCDFKRRGKYLLITLDNGDVWLSHLGMSGRYLIIDENSKAPPADDKHHHIVIKFTHNITLIYDDPRRFGSQWIVPSHQLEQHFLLKDLGSEPLSSSWDLSEFYATLQSKSVSIKTAIMNAKIVVGIGNIYACEALHRAGISPMKLANTLSLDQTALLQTTVRQILSEAIESGGSSISDFRKTDGSKGYFQHHFAVYGRNNEDCQTCLAPHAIVQARDHGRSTYYCPRCQLL